MPAPALLVLLGVFVLSNLLFLMHAAASPAIGFALSALLVGSVVMLFRGVKQAGLGWRWTLGLGATALAVCVVGGAGHLMFTTEDWSIRDSVLHDLIRSPWPVVYPGAHGAERVLRAPLGFYMIPAEVGRWLGAGAAQAAVLAQNALLLGAILSLLVREAQSTRSRLIVAAGFLLFSGWDAAFALMVLLSSVTHHVPIAFGLHIDHLNGLEYSSFLTDIFWAPNHGLPAFAFAAVYFCWRRGECSAAAAAVLAGLCLLWSPLAVMGATPFVAYALLSDLRAERLRLSELALGAVAGMAVLPALVFLQLDGGHVVRGWMTAHEGFGKQYALFFAFDILPVLYLLARGGVSGQGASKVETALTAALLVAIPFYQIGASNDFVMRASVVPLAVAAVIAARKLAELAEARQWSAARPMLIVLAVGAITPALEVARAFIHPASPPVDLPLLEAWEKSPFAWQPQDTYFARAEALARYRLLLKPAPEAARALARRP